MSRPAREPDCAAFSPPILTKSAVNRGFLGAWEGAFREAGMSRARASRNALPDCASLPISFRPWESSRTLGRFFSPEEYHAGREMVAILSYSFWKNHLGADPNIAGPRLFNGWRFL